MMNFEPGDRIRVIANSNGIPKGILGTVVWCNPTLYFAVRVKLDIDNGQLWWDFKENEIQIVKDREL